MRELIDQIILYVQTHQDSLIFYALLLTTILGIVLAFMRKAVFYADYSDLTITAAMFGLPALVLAIGIFYLGQFAITITIAGITFVPLFLTVLAKTWKSNRSVWKTVVILISKTILSFLYVVYLLNALTEKNRSKRGVSWFILAIMTPLMFALVHDKSGKPASLPKGRGRF